MKISFNWLKQYIETDLDAEQAARILTDIGLEVEALEKTESIRGGLAGVVVGHVLTCEKHPDADKRMSRRSIWATARRLRSSAAPRTWPPERK